MPRRNESPAAVAARASRDHNPLTPRFATKHGMDHDLGEVSTRVLHHLEQRNAEVVDHGAVDFSHLRSGHVRDIMRCNRE